MAGLLAAAIVAVAVAGGVGALLAVSTVTSAPVMFLTAGIIVFGLLDAAGAWWVTARRAAPARRRRARWTMLTTSAVLVLGAFAVTLVPPAPAPAPMIPGARLLALSTGSRVAVVTVPASRPAAPSAPVMVLHGGPGIPDLAANTAAIAAPLAALGSDVHLSAQLGTATSTRLADPRGYGRDRDVADVEALRVVLRLDRMTLLGHSYGATVAVAYAAAHPEHVERLVLISPGALDPADTSATRATSGLSIGQTLDLYREMLAPRDLLGYLLLQTNPAAAHAFFGDREADARNDAVLTLAEPALLCHDPPAGLPPVTGSGFYAMQYPQSATAPAPSDIRPALTGLPIPTLIVKGGCDYLSWRSAIDYRNRLPRSQLLYIPDAGHNVQQDQPKAFLAAITAFLHDQPVPGDPITGDAVPQGYRGPP